jgi:hypothetical protein
MSDQRRPPPPKPVPPPDLDAVNARLRNLVSTLRTEKDRLAGRSMTPVPGTLPAARTPPPSADVSSLAERRLAAELEAARAEAREARAERDEIQARLEELGAEHRRISDEYVLALEQTADVARLYAALERLHGGVGRPDVLAAIDEVVVNLIGCEEYGLYERRGDRLELVHSFGLDRSRWASFQVGKGAVGVAARTGRIHVAGREGAPAPEEADLSAAVPLRVGGEVLAVIAIFRLLGHKPLLDERDQALFDLLASHAGIALRLRAGSGQDAKA